MSITLLQFSYQRCFTFSKTVNIFFLLITGIYPPTTRKHILMIEVLEILVGKEQLHRMMLRYGVQLAGSGAGIKGTQAWASH